MQLKDGCVTDKRGQCCPDEDDTISLMSSACALMKVERQLGPFQPFCPPDR